MKFLKSIFEVEISNEKIVYIRQLMRELGTLGGLPIQSQIRFVSAVCEVMRFTLKSNESVMVRCSLASENGADYKLHAYIENKKVFAQYLESASVSAEGKNFIEMNLPANSIVSPEETVATWINKLNEIKPKSIIDELEEQDHRLTYVLTEVEKSSELLSNQQILLKEHTDQLEKANRMKANFVANISHDMRTPLNAIIGISDILSKTVLNKHQQFLVNSLDAAGRSLLLLINDILDLSKLEAGKFEIEDVDFSLNDTIKEALSVVQPQALEKYVDLMLFCGPSLPNKVQGDPHRLQQIIINIVANAIKFSSQNSEADIFIFNNNLSGNMANVRFIIFDTGIGISQNDQSKLFEAFSQIDTASNRKYVGSGLGLSICRHLISLMNGEIGFFSQKDVGTAFWFSIPFVCQNPLDLTLRPNLDSLELVFTENKLLTFELLMKALNIKHRRLKSAEAEKLKTAASRKLIFIDDLPTEFASSRPSRLFNRLMEYAQLPYSIENFRTGKEKFLLGRKPFSKTLAACGNALLVEDHTMNQLIGRLQLEELGFVVDICSTGAEAIQSVSNKKYSIIFMDCQLPEMDGYEITQKIRELEKQTNSHTPIIALTASLLDGEREKCLKAGMDDYLSKPVEPELLYVTCEKWLKNNGTGRKKEIENSQTSLRKQPVIDQQKLLGRLSKDQYLYLVQMFQSDTTTMLVELENYLETQNMEAAIFYAHKLQGASRMIYAKALADNYRNMEEALRAQMWHAAKEILVEVKNQFDQIKDELLISR